MSQNPLCQNPHGIMCILSASSLDIWKVQAIDVLLVSHTHANSSWLCSLCGHQRDYWYYKKMLRTGGWPHVPHILLSASAEYPLAADSCQPPKLNQITPTNPHIVKNRLYCTQCVTPLRIFLTTILHQPCHPTHWCEPVPPHICNNPKFWPYFEDAISAIGGSHFHCVPPAYQRPFYKN